MSNGEAVFKALQSKARSDAAKNGTPVATQEYLEQFSQPDDLSPTSPVVTTQDLSELSKRLDGLNDQHLMRDAWS